MIPSAMVFMALQGVIFSVIASDKRGFSGLFSINTNLNWVKLLNILIDSIVVLRNVFSGNLTPSHPLVTLIALNHTLS